MRGQRTVCWILQSATGLTSKIEVPNIEVLYERIVWRLESDDYRRR